MQLTRCREQCKYKVEDIRMALFPTLKFITRHPLNRGQKLKSVLRFARWQAGCRLVPGAVVCDWINGSRFLARAGETGLTGNIYSGLHEFQEMSYLLHVLRPEDLFIDVGANAGSYTILACAAVGARGIAFEPVPDIFKRLKANVRLNELDDKVVLLNMGLGASPGKIPFTNDDGTVNHAVADGETCANAINVDVTTLDLAMAGQSPALLKIDVEGYETPVLEGAKETLKNESLHSVIMELNESGNRYGYDERHILEVLFDCGFNAYSYDPYLRNLVEIDGKNKNAGNTLFVRNRAFVEARLRGAAQFEVMGQRI